MGLKFSRSLKDNFAFRRLYRKGASAASGCLVMYCRRRVAGENRLGITVSAKLGKAVVRNRVRRRIREIYRLNEHRLSPGWDIVIVARSRAVTAEYRELNGEFLRLIGKLGMVR